MQTMPIFLFKDSFSSFVALLDEAGVKYQVQDPRAGGTVFASGAVIEVLQSAAMWGSLATIVVAFIKNRRGRKVIITTKEGVVIHVEGLSPKELEKILESAKNLTAVDPNKEQMNALHSSPEA